MKMLKLSRSDKALSLLVEYVVIAGILTVFMFFIMTQLNSLLIDTPAKVAMKNQFDDVGNEIASKLVDIALIAPENGRVRVKLHMPYTVGDYDFKAGFVERNGKYFLELKSERLGKTGYYPLSNIALEVIPQGYTFSLSNIHELTYTAESHLAPTAVALAYPAKVIEGENITFDMTHSTGEGILWYRWDFGNNNSTPHLQYDPSNPETVIRSSSGTSQHSTSIRFG
ncbi:MAG TPA: hypothetical protein EYP30_04570 [Archaeoglobaceae archaeon]|nr:hypothetical protein [Archaeoglobaceae archaeon]